MAQVQRPFCQMSDSLVGSVDMHVDQWEKQLDSASNETFNCSVFLEFMYVSRDRILSELEFVRGNFTQEDEQYRGRGDEGLPTQAAISYMSSAASLVSAHIHVHGALVGVRRECLSEHLQLLFLMSLRRMKTLLHDQLRQLWVVFQGTAELLRSGIGKWLNEVVELFEADMKTMASIMVTWEEPTAEKLAAPPTRPGPPLPEYSAREPDGIALSTVEVLRRETFKEWAEQKPLMRALIRYVLPRDSFVADFCAGNGQSASFLNDTGLMTAFAFDSSPNIRLLTKGIVEFARLDQEGLQLWRSFDIGICIPAADDYGQDPEAWGRVWRNLEGHSGKGVIMSCGSGELRQQILSSAAIHAPVLQYDPQRSKQIDFDGTGRICVFWRNVAAWS
jgi:hypothetical protein